MLANPDISEDQELKLYVRNRILAESARMLDDITDRKEVEQIVRQNMPRLRAVAAEEITQCGYQYPVDVELESIYFTMRHYQQIMLPTGTYDALRVTIGQV